MIQPLRKVHGFAFAAFALCLPVLFAEGLLSRHKWATASTSTKSTLTEDRGIVSSQTELSNGLKFEVRIFADKARGNELAIQLIPDSTLVVPDVLVYWSEAETKLELPVNAQLLGTFRPTGIYHVSTTGKGYIILYSLALGRVVGSFPIGVQP